MAWVLDSEPDDLDATVVEEKIYHDAGALAPHAMTREEIARLIREASREPVEPIRSTGRSGIRKPPPRCRYRDPARTLAWHNYGTPAVGLTSSNCLHQSPAFGGYRWLLFGREMGAHTRELYAQVNPVCGDGGNHGSSEHGGLSIALFFSDFSARELYILHRLKYC
jgi:hypothetical protein